MDELLAEFIAETLETLDTLSSEVVAWEADPSDRARLDAFFRFFHTVKGSCGFLDLPRFERLSHAAEDVLAAIRDGNRQPDAATISAVLAIMDRIGALARALAEDTPPVEGDDDRLLDALLVPTGAHEDEPPPIAPAVEDAQGQATSHRALAMRTIRLPLMLIDQLMHGVSDMVLARNELSRRMRERPIDADLESSFERLSTCVADLRDMISRTRMQRVERLYAAIPRMVRDLGMELGKSVTVELDGGEVEMDREMIEMVVDPLTHIVRNALDHGIEAPAIREAAGKPPAGRLRIQARQSGNQIAICVSDDGRGINRAALVEKAIKAKLITPAEAAAMSPAEQIQLIFEAGLSTAKAVTAISGRGVGMDVVRANVEHIGGTIGIDSTEGEGTVITLRVPLTLTIIPGLIVRAGGQLFAMPRGNVVELLHASNAMVTIERVAQAMVATIRGEGRSMIDLEDVLGLPMTESEGHTRTLMVVRAGTGQPYVLAVDAVENNEELVVRPASPLVTASGLYAGMTLPDTGCPMLLLDAAGIAHHAELPMEAAGPVGAAGRPALSPVEGERMQALQFVALDGARRLIPLAVVDRVEDLPLTAFGVTGGDHFAQIDGAVVPVTHAPSGGADPVCCLRLRAGEDILCYPIASIVDILAVSTQIDLPATEAGDSALAGVVVHEGEHFEMIDPFALFARHFGGDGRTAAPLAARHCLIAPDGDGWMRSILAPLLRQAGHVVLEAPQAGVRPDVILCGDDAGEASHATHPDTPVLRLRSGAAPQGADASIYRYDRAAVLAAIAQIGREEAA